MGKKKSTLRIAQRVADLALGAALTEAMGKWANDPDTMHSQRFNGQIVFCWIPADQMKALGHTGTFFALEIEPVGFSKKLPGLPVSGFATPFWKKGTSFKERDKVRG